MSETTEVSYSRHSCYTHGLQIHSLPVGYLQIVGTGTKEITPLHYLNGKRLQPNLGHVTPRLTFPFPPVGEQLVVNFKHTLFIVVRKGTSCYTMLNGVGYCAK